MFFFYLLHLLHSWCVGLCLKCRNTKTFVFHKMRKSFYLCQAIVTRNNRVMGNPKFLSCHRNRRWEEIFQLGHLFCWQLCKEGGGAPCVWRDYLLLCCCLSEAGTERTKKIIILNHSLLCPKMIVLQKKDTPYSPRRSLASFERWKWYLNYRCSPEGCDICRLFISIFIMDSNFEVSLP